MTLLVSNGALGHLADRYGRIGRRHLFAVDDVGHRKRPVVCRADRPLKTHTRANVAAAIMAARAAISEV